MSDPIDNNGESATVVEDNNLRSWRADPHWDIDGDHAEYAKFSMWCQSWRNYWKARETYTEGRSAAYWEQWPWFYADAMLAARAR